MKIICIGRNYAAHAAELGNQVPEEPVIFMKPKNALLPPGASFYYPAFSNEVHYECELVVRIAKNGKNITRDKAREYYSEITCGLDFTARDVQDRLKGKGLPWEKAKAFDGSAAVGTWISVDQLPDLGNIRFQLHKNGQLVQDGQSAHMLHSIDAIIAHVSEYFTLNIGDLVFTGTPAGVGEIVITDELEAVLEGKPVLHIDIR